MPAITFPDEESPEQLLSGYWVGGVEFRDRWVYMQAHFTVAEDSLQATIDLPLDAGIGLVPATLDVEPAQLRFELVWASEQAIFTGQLINNEIIGEMQQGMANYPFRLVQVAHSPFDFPPELVGTYQLAPDHFVFIGNMLGSYIPAYHDLASGRIGAVFPASEDTYFAGPALLVPYPRQVELTFSRNEQGDITGLTWRQPGQADIFVSKIQLVEQEVTFRNGNVTLAGTLFLPPTQGPHPAVLIVHGSGPQTRHMVRLYSDTLARHGVAALAYDKRGVGASAGDWRVSSFKDLAADALAGIEFLRSHPDINPNKIGVCGSSQAGWVMPLAANCSAHITFLIILAGPATTVMQQILDNIAYSMRADGFSEEDIQTALTHAKLFWRVLCTGEGWEAFQQSLERGRHSAWSTYAWALDEPPSVDKVPGICADLQRDPLPTLQQISCPVLALFGESDTVVPAEENMQLMEQALRDGRNSDYTIRVLSQTTHTFLRSSTGSGKEFPVRTEWATEHMDMIMKWLLKRINVASSFAIC